MAVVDASKWLEAVRQEIKSLEKNGTLFILKAPKNKRIAGCKWVFKKKEGLSSKSGPIYKARVVAKGYS